MTTSNESNAQPVENNVNANMGDALHAIMNGETPKQTDFPSPDVVTHKPLNVPSSLDNLKTRDQINAEREQQNTTDTTPSVDGNTTDVTPPTDSNVPELELKVKGYDEPQKIKLDPNDERLSTILKNESNWRPRRWHHKMDNQDNHQLDNLDNQLDNPLVCLGHNQKYRLIYRPE